MFLKNVNKSRDISRLIGTNVTWAHISLQEILRELVPPGRWHIRDVRNNLPVPKEVKYVHDEYRVRRYLVRRDKYRSARGEPPYWAGTHLEFAAYCWEVADHDRGVWGGAKRVKWLLDKGVHGRNMAKGKMGEDREI